MSLSSLFSFFFGGGGALPDGEVSNPLVSHWPGLTVGDCIWMDGATSVAYARGALIPDIAIQLYGSPSEVLIEKAAKSLVWNLHYYTTLVDCVQDAGRIEELKAGVGPEAVAAVEQRVADLENEVARLKSELEGAGQQQASLREQLKESHGRVRSMEGELLDLSRILEEARSSVMKAEEALVEEI
ncbi:hypothetical protein C4D60_Mb11t14880 [Musa balbisiana]|uniref:Uncharacterized protein n=1 Tax=Musa balbisiana TaxID=52838 RepID=A0A4S8J489_MUSBA|nr:hypothetical protein C4D60_Mb11t14880 [Musa balbisiana]